MALLQVTSSVHFQELSSFFPAASLPISSIFNQGHGVTCWSSGSNKGIITFPKVLPVIVKNRISELELLSLWDWNFLETELYNYYLKLYMYHPLFLGEWFECPCHHFYWKNSLLKCLQCLYIFITNKVHKKLKYDKYNFLQVKYPWTDLISNWAKFGCIGGAWKTFLSGRI